MFVVQAISALNIRQPAPQEITLADWKGEACSRGKVPWSPERRPIHASAARCCCSSVDIPLSDREHAEGFHRMMMTAAT